MSIQANEKAAIKTYCTVARQIEQTKQGFQQELKKHKLEADTHRVALFELMKASDIACLPYDGGYARIKLNNSMRAVTKEVVEDALQLLTPELVQEEKKSNPGWTNQDALVEAILKLIQSRRTKSKEYVEFSKYKPKNFNPTNQRIDDRVQEACANWQKAKVEVENVKRTQKHATKGMIDQQKSCEVLVKQFMDRAELSSQRININHHGGTQTYFIKNKVSTTKPRITKELIQKSVKEALQGMQSTEDVLRNKQSITMAIFEILDNRPTTRKKCMKLVKGMLNKK